MQQPFKKLSLKIQVTHHQDAGGKLATKQKTDAFHRLSVKIANKLGSSWAFYIALVVILIWGLSGTFFDFSDTWQLVINTGTTIVTFLMVFVIQNTQNRDGKAMQLKLDELISASAGARTKFVDVEDLTDAELNELQNQFHEIHEKLQAKVRKAESTK